MPMGRRWVGTNDWVSAEAMHSPSMWMEPPVGRSRPASNRSVVVLPQPLGPSKVTKDPGSAVNDMPLTAVNPPAPSPNFLSRADTLIIKSPGHVGIWSSALGDGERCLNRD